MGRRRNKDLAESQFNFNAAPVNLRQHFDLFKSPEINEDFLEPESEDNSLNEIFHFQNEEIPINVEHLVQLADDLIPTNVEEFKDDIKPVEQIIDSNIDYTDYLDFMDIVFKTDIIEEKSMIDEINFQTHHQEIKDQLNLDCPDSITTAINLIEVAIDKMSSEERRKFRLKDTKNQYFSNHVLITKSSDSIKFINGLGFKLIERLKDKNPDLFSNFPKQNHLMVDWFNEYFDSFHNLKFPIMCSIIAIRLKNSDIRSNYHCGLKMGFNDYGKMFTTYQILNFLNLRSIDETSIHFSNLQKVIFNFNRIYGGRRLSNLEKICEFAYRGKLFYKSDNYLFAELTNSRFKNEELNLLGNSVNEQILRNLKKKSSLHLGNRDHFQSPHKSMI